MKRCRREVSEDEDVSGCALDSTPGSRRVLYVNLGDAGVSLLQSEHVLIMCRSCGGSGEAGERKSRPTFRGATLPDAASRHPNSRSCASAKPSVEPQFLAIFERLSPPNSTLSTLL